MVLPLIIVPCTFNPGENEENIRWLTGKHETEIVRLNISDFKGITEIDYQGINGYGFYPDKVQGEGFFISVIRKKGKQESIHQGNIKSRNSNQERKTFPSQTNGHNSRLTGF